MQLIHRSEVFLYAEMSQKMRQLILKRIINQASINKNLQM